MFIFFVFFLTLDFCFAEEPQPCRYELTPPKFFFVRTGEKPPGQDQLPSIGDVILDLASDLIEEYVGRPITGVIKASAFAVSSTKYYADMYVVYSYRFIHKNKTKSKWEPKQEKVLNGNTDFFTAGDQGVSDAARAKDYKIRTIKNYLEGQLKEQCAEHQN